MKKCLFSILLIFVCGFNPVFGAKCLVGNVWKEEDEQDQIGFWKAVRSGGIQSLKLVVEPHVPISIRRGWDLKKRRRVDEADKNFHYPHINCRDRSSGMTALMWTIKNSCNLKQAELLLRHRADVNLQDSKDNTALHYALDVVDPKIKKQLVDGLILCKANHLLKNEKCKSPLDIARNREEYDLVLAMTLPDVPSHMEHRFIEPKKPDGLSNNDRVQIALKKMLEQNKRMVKKKKEEAEEKAAKQKEQEAKNSLVNRAWGLADAAGNGGVSVFSAVSKGAGAFVKGLSGYFGQGSK